jgi:hypothetical protein
MAFCLQIAKQEFKIACDFRNVSGFPDVEHYVLI